jgi:ABC-2 type transport system ATP-binding protein
LHTGTHLPGRVLGLAPVSGSVEVHRRTGYLPGGLALFPRLTGRARAVDDLLARRLADRFQVVADRPVRELSKGNRQKIALVLAFMHHPELLILDEPARHRLPPVRPQLGRRRRRCPLTVAGRHGR